MVAICDHLEGLKFSTVLPHAFTEHGVLQAANVINSPKENQVSIQVIRIFNNIREIALTNLDIKTKLRELEEKMDSKFASSDQSFKAVFETLNHILYPPEKPKRIGFVRGEN